MHIGRKPIAAVIGILVLCGLMLNLSATASAAEPTLQDVITAAKNAENAVQNIKIEYSVVGNPLGQDSAAKKLAHPERYKPATCVYFKKGNKERLEQVGYHASSPAEAARSTICYNGSITLYLESKDKNLGKVSAGRWHRLRTAFNPVSTFTIAGDKKLSEELSTMSAELVAGLHNVGGVSCRLVKVYKKTPKGTILRSYKAYLDPARNYAPVKVEKYWFNFLCLERTVETQQFTKVGSTYVASKAKCTVYNRPHKSSTSNAVLEIALTATSVKVNQGISDSTFELTFPPETRVWDDITRITYTIPTPELPEL